MMTDEWERATKAGERLGIKPAARLLVVSIARQRLGVFEAGRSVREFDVSTSEKPPSNIAGSLGTPRGLHAICEKIGAGAPRGMVFRGRVATGKFFWETEAPAGRGNLITTRILRLRGLEPGVNAGSDRDTFARLVYVHGTNCEARVGTPQSHGCVLLRNADIEALFDMTEVGDWVWVE
jgi:hypothetical protein